jgi:hypothetical protein
MSLAPYLSPKKYKELVETLKFLDTIEE